MQQESDLEQFDADKNFFWHANAHDPAHNSFFGVYVDQALVNAHLPFIPSLCAFAAR